jgi:large subunit ribosomal protein L30
VPKLTITQTKSYSGAPEKHRRTLKALGLRHQRSVVHEDTPAIRGMLFQVRHMVKVEATEGQVNS